VGIQISIPNGLLRPFHPRAFTIAWEAEKGNSFREAVLEGAFGREKSRLFGGLWLYSRSWPLARGAAQEVPYYASRKLFGLSSKRDFLLCPRIAQRDVSSEKKWEGMTASKGLKKNE
jgi:hypothetical protein